MNIILTGGGTGGHIAPLIAIAEELRARYPDIRIGYVGRSKSKDGDAFKPLGIPTYTVTVSGIQRHGGVEALRAIRMATYARREAREILRRFKPNAVIATGGYACWPTASAAISEGIPTVLHEANASAGLAVRMLAGRSDLVLLGQKQTAGISGIFVGNPVKREFFNTSRAEARQKLGIPQNAFFIASQGGSGGANELNRAAIEAMKRICLQCGNVYFMHSTGKKYYDDVREKHPELCQGGNARVVPYITDMPSVLAAADLAISRCGAMALAELAASATPAILIPSPNVTNDHQRKNARQAATGGAATVIEENERLTDALTDEIMRLINDKAALEAMKKSQASHAMPDAAARIVDLIEKRLK
jgi:UDP-N-acetylglucosamine--N-acetylmuramyl-(pentapeptide) pyrophosphoryl-undecaprenol N-acetylglucosamine transferase